MNAREKWHVRLRRLERKLSEMMKKRAPSSEPKAIDGKWSDWLSISWTLDAKRNQMMQGDADTRMQRNKGTNITQRDTRNTRLSIAAHHRKSRSRTSANIVKTDCINHLTFFESENWISGPSICTSAKFVQIFIGKRTSEIMELVCITSEHLSWKYVFAYRKWIISRYGTVYARLNLTNDAIYVNESNISKRK